VFRVASVSKIFTAAAVLLLVRDGVLSLDDDVRDYVAELPDYGAPVSIRRLLNHTGGLPEYETLYFSASEPDAMLDYDSATRADQLAAIVSLPELTSQPGERYAYTNTAYLLLALIVERVSGMSLQDFTQMRIFGPLAMMDTGFRGGIGRVSGDAIPYHRTEAGTFMASPAAAHIGPTGLQTSVRDLLRWGRHLASDAALTQMMETHETLNDHSPVGHGYGVFLRDVGGGTLLFHPGGTKGVSALFAYLPGTGTSIAILCNRDDLDTLALAVSMVRIYEN
jgi:CubicO group peptidase (beta-lactamase class C family)